MKLRLILLISLVLVSLSSEARTAPKRSSKGKAKTEEAAKPAPKKTPYEKFTSKKGVKSVDGFVRLWADKKQYYLEIPDSLMGRKILLSTSLLEGSAQFFTPGMEVSKRKVFQLSRTDSLLLLTEAAPLRVIKDTSMTAGLGKSSIPAVRYAFPLKYRNADSTAVVALVSKLFDPSNKDAFDLKSVPIDARYSVNKGSPVADLTILKSLVKFSSSVGLVQEATFNVAPMAGMGGGLSIVYDEESEKFTGTFQTTITLLPDDDMPLRKADPHVGVLTTSYPTWDSDKGYRTDGAALRWDIREGKKITVYVDTLFSPQWKEAIRKGILAWNPPFEAIGLGKVIDVRPYASYGEFSAEDPTVFTVRSSSVTGTSPMTSSLRYDVSSGRIIGGNIVITPAITEYAREAGMMTICDVDPRFRKHTISDDAVCEVLRAMIMRLFGRDLGLLPNLAGSMAYTPAQLRSPDFTRVHGITASVTDDVLFNVFARPGDKEKGLVTLINKIGAYDSWAIEWLYREFPEGTDEEAALRQMVASKIGKSEYLFVPSTTGYPDWRGLQYDLGNDPAACYDASLSHLKYAAHNAFDWFKEDPDISEDDIYVFVERLWLRTSRLSQMLVYNIGGVAPQEIGGQTKYLVRPEEQQRFLLDKVYGNIDNFSWIDEEKDLMALSGANTDYSSYSVMNSSFFALSVSRVPYIAMAEFLAGSSFGVREYLGLVTDHLTASIRKGKLRKADDYALTIYITNLAGLSPSLKSNMERHFHSNGFAAREETAVQAPLRGVPSWCLQGLEEEAVIQLERLKKILVSARGTLRTPEEKGMVDYLLSSVDAALDN